jgi:hypothetical protein
MASSAVMARRRAVSMTELKSLPYDDPHEKQLGDLVRAKALLRTAGACLASMVLVLYLLLVFAAFLANPILRRLRSLIFDAVGKSFFVNCGPLLAPGGTFVTTLPKPGLFSWGWGPIDCRNFQ